MKTIKNYLNLLFVSLVLMTITSPTFSQTSVSSLPDLSTVDIVDVDNIRLKDVEKAFNNIKKEGNKKSFKGEPWIVNMVESHVQGIAQYNDYYVVTHNDKGQSKGKIMIINRESDKLVNQFKTPYEHYNHPGGLQVIGDYAAVAIENSSYDKSYIAFYDLGKMTNNTKPTLMPYEIKRSSKGAGAVGITNVKKDGQTHYWVAAVAGKKVDFYYSNGSKLHESDLSFSKKFTAELNQKDYQGIQLVSDQSNQVYLIGFRSASEWPSYKDKMVLFKVDTKNGELVKIKDRHMESNHGSVTGQAGVHYRWGAGLSINSTESMKAFATQRNFSGNKLYTNTFNAKQ